MSKVTSLSAQLKRLQVPQSSLLNTVADRRRVSFLYDPSEAANMDSEAVYSLAMNGLEQLKSIDRHTFESFEATLFNATSINFERAVQTKQVNAKLDDELRRFLVHLAPYFMLRPAHKCLEWLVYRYQVHAYNADLLFMCALPYHETNYFVRVLQMLDLEQATPVTQLWLWLVDNQKRGVPLAPLTLATHLYSDLSFFNYIIGYLNYALELFSDEARLESDAQAKHWSNSLNFVFSFIAKTLLQTVGQLALSSGVAGLRKNANNKQQEAFLAQLLPVLFTGFKSDIIVYKQTSYLLCSFLFEKFKFTADTTNKALFAIAKGLSTFRLDTSGQVGGSKMDVDNDDEENNELLQGEF
jgi:U3 small nucleolar RNA-associated protein 10